MSRTFSISSVMLLSLPPAIAFAAPVHMRHIYHWHGYGFLPDHHQPPDKAFQFMARKDQSAAFQAMRHAARIMAGGTTTAIPGFTVDATTAAVSTRVGL
jgi:cytosine/adenosine deaminase-related metal-dependent hydrolase